MRKALFVALIAIAVIIIIIAAAGVYKFNFTDSDIYYQACTMEAKICPDGSAVGRTGPNCQFAECPKANPVPSKTTDTSFTIPATYHISEKLTYDDGLTVQLVKISSSLCPPNANCIWQGELNPIFKITGKGFSNEIQLGTETKKNAKVDVYTIELVDATTTTATIKVLHPLLGDVAGCYIGGCSSQICSDQSDAMSTCEFRPEYSCYKTATCERQQNGACGWTQTKALSQCLVNYQ